MRSRQAPLVLAQFDSEDRRLTIVVIGSQAILGHFPDAPASLRVSTEQHGLALRDRNAGPG